MRSTVTGRIVGVAMALILAGAGCSGPQPILQPNAHLETVGKQAAEEDIDSCRDMAETAGSAPGRGKTADTATSTAVGAATGAASGAVGGAVVGAAGSGSMIGAAGGAVFGLLGGLLTPSSQNSTYVNFVNRCLHEQGYEVAGWR